MNLAPMRFKSYVWPHNPETYTITFTRKIVSAKVPFGRYGMQNLGMSYRVMEGEGVFTGENAYREFQKLASVFYEESPGTLVHPVWQTTEAYFVSLEVMQQPLEDYVRYRFAFWETSPLGSSLIHLKDSASTGQSAGSAGSGTYTVVRGDTLWGIAKRQGVSLSEMLKVNPQIKNPNSIAVGEQVVLP